MRRLALVLLMLVPTVAHGEDVGAIVAAMPDQGAELRYLKLLCDRANGAEQSYVNAMGARIDCLAGTKCDDRTEAEQAKREVDVASLGETVALKDHWTADSIYKAKRDTPAPGCDADLEGLSRVTSKIKELTAAIECRSFLDACRQSSLSFAAMKRAGEGKMTHAQRAVALEASLKSWTADVEHRGEIARALYAKHGALPPCAHQCEDFPFDKFEKGQRDATLAAPPK
jgi:hypothetical protein